MARAKVDFTRLSADRLMMGSLANRRDDMVTLVRHFLR
jgi:transcriptional regulator with AAA-type ATPase domain